MNAIFSLKKPSGPVDFASELAKKIGVSPVAKPPSPIAAEDDEEDEEKLERKGRHTPLKLIIVLDKRA